MKMESLSSNTLSKQEIIGNLVSLIGTVAAMVYFNWQPEDLVWGFWICSLTFGYLTVLVAIFTPAVRIGGITGLKSALGGLILLFFFTHIFMGLHLTQVVWLNQYTPFMESGSRSTSTWATLLFAISNYWPLILVTMVSRFRDLPFDSEFFKSDGRRDAEAVAKCLNPFIKPFLNVARMHVMVLIVVLMHLFEMGSFFIYPVLLFYFFPWRRVFGRKKAAA